MEYSTILLEKKNGITTITLNRPQKLNALNSQMFIELYYAFRKIAEDKDTRVLVITGAGRGFCSGADLTPQTGKQAPGAEGKPQADLEGITAADFVREAPIILSAMKKPAIAAINGVAVGGGLTLTLGCDIRIASETARFGLPLTHRNFTFELGSSYFLSRIVGIGKAAEMIFTGRMIDAAEAREIGLVNHVVPPDQLLKAIYEMAGNIARAAPLALEFSKAGLYQGLNADLPAQMRWEVLANDYLGRTEDRREAIQAFIEKRDPVFKGR